MTYRNKLSNLTKAPIWKITWKAYPGSGLYFYFYDAAGNRLMAINENHLFDGDGMFFYNDIEEEDDSGY